MTLLSEQLKAKRIDAGLSQEALAERLNVGVYLIQAIEEGKTDPHQAFSKSKISSWYTLPNNSEFSSGHQSLLLPISLISKLFILSIILFIFSIFYHLYNDAIKLDRAVLITVLACAVIGRRNKSIFFTCTLYALTLAPNDIMFSALLNSENFTFNAIIYILTLLVIPLLKNNTIKFLVLCHFLVNIGLESWWYITEYDSPKIAWFTWITLSNLATIYFLKTKEYILFKKHRTISELRFYDKVYFYFSNLLLVMTTLCSLEYGVRHIIGYEVFIFYFGYWIINLAFSIIFITLIIDAIIRDKLWK
ncbi:helix-turn-helix domain-containing protein [Aestuariibacter sp. AA17]|uniref:Helix-turn-helix domain-containing protein n=1 Tax=Fluctibacter corallii TaxID=2984329 RepID=A0ABT3A6T2_9ALTE|nr:helix-turn-helix domain-containing protein [Aestuariibacter sp. AA17]MCV2884395.1 helix-turn-helix domain-containing protein [Aestuariibacter sp. AA17]